MTPTRQDARTLVAVGALSALGLAGCGSDGPAGPPVAIIGDSITGQLADDYADADVDFDLTVRATNGATTAEMLDDARDIADEDFDQVILNLGTNDAINQLPIDETIAAYGEMLALFDGARCIHLTTLNEGVISPRDEAVDERMFAINEHLRALADEHGELHIIDWNAALRNHEANGNGEPLLIDTVHPNGGGQALLRDLSVQALNDCA